MNLTPLTKNSDMKFTPRYLVPPHLNKTLLQSLRILVVEDNSDNQSLIKTVLERYSAAVIVANNGVEGFNLAANYDYDVIIMDIQMPQMDGYLATSLIREYDSKTPIIALTANATAEEKRRCLSSGFNMFMTKPIDFGALVSAVASVASRHQEKIKS